MPKEKEEKIEVDKDFLLSVLKLVQDLKTDIALLKQGSFKEEASELNQPAGIPSDTIFQCLKTMSIGKIPPSSEEATLYTQKSEEFRDKLEVLMKDYKIIQLTAMFLKKL